MAKNSKLPDPIHNMSAQELRAEIIRIRASVADFVNNYNANVDSMHAMQEEIIDLDQENETLQMRQDALITTIAILSEGAA
jgi:hypothetical protein